MAYTAISLGLPPGTLSSSASAVSGDGSLVVGSAVRADASFVAIVWDASNNPQVLPGLGGSGKDFATGCSDDGSIIVGFSANASEVRHAVYWDGGPSWAVHDLGTLVGSPANESFAFGCSSDASLIVGFSQIMAGSSSSACIWSGFGAPTAIPAGPTDTVAIACSPSGTVIVGGSTALTAAVTPASSWHPSWTLTALGDLPGSIGASAATGCTNGGLIVGFASDSGGDTFAGTWTGSVFSLLDGADANSSALGCDPTGDYVVGNSSLGAVLWISGVIQVLPLFVGAISIYSAAAISSDLSTIVGSGQDSSFNAVAVKWTGSAPPPPPATGPAGFLICGNDWTITQPVTKLYGFDHLIGRDVVGLADGVPLDPITVAADGSVTLPFAASYVTLGLAFTVQMQTPYIDTGNPTAQGRRKNITAVTVRVDASGAPFSGTNQPDGGSFTPTQVGPAWSNMQPSVTQDPEQFPGTYLSPAGETVTLLFSGDFRANLQPGWDERGQVAVEQTLPVPLSITAVVPELLQGDTAEQTYAQQQGGGGQGDDSRGPGLWMLTSRGRR